MATLITGGTGLIGLALADRLVARGGRVVLFDRAVPEAALARVAAHGDRLHVVPGDVQALGELLEVLDKTPEMRTKAADQLEKLQHKAEGAMDTAKDRIASGLRAGQEYLRAGGGKQGGGPRDTPP